MNENKCNTLLLLTILINYKKKSVFNIITMYYLCVSIIIANYVSDMLSSLSYYGKIMFMKMQLNMYKHIKITVKCCVY